MLRGIILSVVWVPQENNISQDHKLDYVIHYSTQWKFIECLSFDSYSNGSGPSPSERLAGGAVADEFPLAILMPSDPRARGPLCNSPLRLPT